MKRRLKQTSLFLLSVLLIFSIICVSKTELGAKSRHLLNKLAVKAKVKVAQFRGAAPERIALKGRIQSHNEPFRGQSGARVEAIDSHSGWATLTDETGEFTLPDVLWYPDGEQSLIISTENHFIRRVNIHLPASVPADRVVEVGEINLDEGCVVELEHLQGANSIHQIHFDRGTRLTFKELFSSLTANQTRDEERFEAVNTYIAAKLREEDPPRRSESPTRTLEDGSSFCGDLALLFAAIAEAGNYQARLLDLSDGLTNGTSHMVVEVYYADGWHLYDPGLGVSFRETNGRVLSFKEVKLKPQILERTLAQGWKRSPLHLSYHSISEVYKSGLHHFYATEKNALFTLW